ncbi:hypothetical protein SADUNF_Sadunf16G0076500 [Salix dunnii]|uniref:Transcription factor CBF/NF-Y/archaeal histone domain-containing protein n=1 Tax=Salix dunnii TaxID=1413687 RepID=A0A835J9S6_9ROSI|nr:hypothetical protein SADUNF_Sadunf16G0076500 [Salix dunnii]
MKKALPANGKIAKDAKETVQECVSEFISFITSEASDKCQREKRKTINGDDLLWAMATLGFEDYIDPLKIYLSRYREGDTKGSAKAGDTSAKKDVHPGPNAQISHQGSFSQGVTYGNSNSQVSALSISLTHTRQFANHSWNISAHLDITLIMGTLARVGPKNAMDLDCFIRGWVYSTGKVQWKRQSDNWLEGFVRLINHGLQEISVEINSLSVADTANINKNIEMGSLCPPSSHASDCSSYG